MYQLQNFIKATCIRKYSLRVSDGINLMLDLFSSFFKLILLIKEQQGNQKFTKTIMKLEDGW